MLSVESLDLNIILMSVLRVKIFSTFSKSWSWHLDKSWYQHNFDVSLHSLEILNIFKKLVVTTREISISIALNSQVILDILKSWSQQLEKSWHQLVSTVVTPRLSFWWKRDNFESVRLTPSPVRAWLTRLHSSFPIEFFFQQKFQSLSSFFSSFFFN